jgi:hypothetical protein
MSVSLYKASNVYGTDIIYNYFDLTSTTSISTSYTETQTDNTKLKSNSALFSHLKHIGNIGYKINDIDIASQYVPKCLVFGSFTTQTINVPTITNRIVFLLQAPGGEGANGSESPDNNGGDGGSGALYMGYIDRSVNQVTSVTLDLTDYATSARINSSLTFTGGTSLIVYCASGQGAPGTNDGGLGGFVTLSASTSGLTQIYSYGGKNGTNSDREETASPYTDYISGSATTTYYPLYTGQYGVGGRGGSYGGSGAAGKQGICAIWFLV